MDTFDRWVNSNRCERSVRTFSFQIISEQCILQQSLKGMYQSILDFIPKECNKLKDALTKYVYVYYTYVYIYICDDTLSGVWHEDTIPLIS